MQPDWLKHPQENYWSAQLGPLSLSIFATMFGNFSYLVSDRAQVRKAGNVGGLEAAQAEAERLARELGA